MRKNDNLINLMKCLMERLIEQTRFGLAPISQTFRMIGRRIVRLGEEAISEVRCTR